jgi:hypothetical protein
MWQLLEAGLVAAGRQLIAVAILTSALLLLATPKVVSQNGSASGEVYFSVSQFLTWAYLLSAVGLILTRSRSVVRTATHIRNASRIVRQRGALRTLVVQFGLAAVAFMILALRPPPESLVEISRYLGCADVASVVWAGTMSVGVAGFGAGTHAAVRAF